ncbi:MAG: hypothetical protein IPI52_15320 [Bacteroidetes bacterium]|nr:hypothetical protein [Bacteroidota bacterium]
MQRTTATFAIIDIIAPTIDTDASDLTVACDGQGNTAALPACGCERWWQAQAMYAG